MGCPSACTGYEIGTGDATKGGVVIDMAGITWTSGISGFTATLEGNHNTIANLTVLKDGTTDRAGLFDRINTGGVVRNLGLTGVNIRARQKVGALAGQSIGLIFNTYSTGSVTAMATASAGTASDAGGLVGYVFTGGKIYASHSSASVKGSSPGTVKNIGGLVGHIEASGEIKASYAAGGVTAQTATTQQNIGGLAGSLASGSIIQASYSVATVTAGSVATNVGGLVGSSAGTVTHSYWDTEASGQSASAGGTGKTTAQLKAETGYTGIYTNWNLTLNSQSNLWRFPPGQYPVLAPGAPNVTRVDLLSQPAAVDTFVLGESINVRLTFDQAVTHGGLNWGPYLTLHSQDGWFRGQTGVPTNLRRGQQYTTLDFTYGVQPGASVIDRLVVGRHEEHGGGLVMGGTTLTSTTGAPVYPVLPLASFNFKVDGGEAPRPEYSAAFGPCREFLTGLSPWSDRYELWRQWGVGCDSRSHPGHHAMYYTFTLGDPARVRLHVEGSSAYGATPLMILRQGQSYSGDELHRGGAYTVPYFMRIDEVLPAGTYTLEVATSKPGISGHSFRVRMGTPATPESAAVWTADLTAMKLTSANIGCAGNTLDVNAGNSCGARLTDHTVTLEGTEYAIARIVSPVNGGEVNFQLQGTNNLPTLTSALSLYIDGHEFPFSSATFNANLNTARWTVPGLKWPERSEGYKVPLMIAGSACVNAMGPDDSNDSYDDTGRWSAACASVSNPGSHAVYYLYTPDANGATTLTVTSPNAVEELYLWDGDRLIDQHSSQTASCYGKCARITQWLTAGKTYTIEVTSDGAPTGDYLLALRRTLLFTTSTREPADAPSECRETVVVERSTRFGRNASGTFGWPCHSVAKAGHYAGTSPSR